MYQGLLIPGGSPNGLLNLRKHLYDPYVEERVFRYFLQFDHDQLSPPDKPLVRQALAEELGGLLPNRLGRRVPMQKGLSVDVLFKALLQTLW